MHGMPARKRGRANLLSQLRRTAGSFRHCFAKEIGKFRRSAAPFGKNDGTAESVAPEFFRDEQTCFGRRGRGRVNAGHVAAGRSGPDKNGAATDRSRARESRFVAKTRAADVFARSG